MANASKDYRLTNCAMWFAVREVLHGSHKVAGYQILVKHLSCQLAQTLVTCLVKHWWQT